MKPVLSSIQFSMATDQKTSRTMSAIMAFICNSGMSIRRACSSFGINKSDFYNVFQLLTEKAPNSFRYDLMVAPINRNHIREFYLMKFDLETFVVKDSGVQTEIEIDVRALLKNYPFLHPIGKPRLYDVQVVNLRGESARETAVESVAADNKNRAHPDSLQMKRWCHLSFSNDVSFNITTHGFETHGDRLDEERTTLTAHQSSHRFNEDPDPNESLSVSVTMYVPLMVVNPPSDFDINKVHDCIMNNNSHTDKTQDNNMTLHDNVVLSNAAHELMYTDKPLGDIVQEVAPGASELSFHELFVRKYHCTPAEYRENYRANNPVKPETSKEVFDFDVIVQRPNVGPHAMPYSTDPISQNAPTLPLVVNECFEYVVHIIVKSGTLPYNDAKEFLRSDDRHKFHALVIDQLSVYHLGRLDIAYMQHVLQSSYPRPSGPIWSMPSNGWSTMGRR